MSEFPNESEHGSNSDTPGDHHDSWLVAIINPEVPVGAIDIGALSDVDLVQVLGKVAQFFDKEGEVRTRCWRRAD